MSTRVVMTASEILALSKKPKAKARKHTAGKMNKTEASYETCLKLRMSKGDLLWYAFEPFSLSFGDDARYTPDFVTVDSDSEITAVDVKPRMKSGQPWIEEASLVRIKACAEKYWWMRFVIAWPLAPDMMAWNLREVGE